MKYVKLFEQFIKENTAKPNPDSDVVADDITLEDERVISSAEIIGAIINSESEKELEDYFYDKYGQTAFRAGELAEIKQLWNEYQAEVKELEAEEEGEEEAPATEGEPEAEGEAEDGAADDILDDL